MVYTVLLQLKRRICILVASILFVAVIALPIKNIYAAFRFEPSAFTELNIGSQDVYVIGEGATYFARKLQEYSDLNELNLVVFGPDDANDANTVLIPLYSFDHISALPEHWQICGERCNEESPGQVYAAAVSETGLLRRKWKVTYIQLKPFSVDGTVEGERFNCAMQLMAAEAKFLFPTQLEDFDDCHELLSEGGGTHYRFSTSFSLFNLKIGI